MVKISIVIKFSIAGGTQLKSRVPGILRAKIREIRNPAEESFSEDTKDESLSVMKVLKSLNTWSYCAFYCIGCTRIKSIQGWIYPWMEWSYSTVPDSKELVSQQLDIYGYLYLASPLIGFVPGVLSVLFQKLTSKLPA